MIKVNPAVLVTAAIFSDEPPQSVEIQGDITAKVVRCRYCKGGVHHGYICPVCHGEGVLTIPLWVIVRPKAAGAPQNNDGASHE